jgi:hypothetical protein
MKQRLFAVFLLTAIVTKTYAVRPFITDDAAVVGYRLAQLETWMMFDRFSSQHWFMLGYGLHKRFELSVGAIYGNDRPDPERSEFSYAMPLLQAKFLFREYQPNKLPGVALAAGTFLPTGKGGFVPPGYGAYSFLTVTQCFGEDENVLIHGNIGANYLYVNKEDQLVAIWGLGTQIKAYKGLHVVGEIFSGDPYVPGTGLAYQTGFRYFVSSRIQIDATMGQGLAGQNKMPFWAGFGARFVINKFEKKRKTIIIGNKILS